MNPTLLALKAALVLAATEAKGAVKRTSLSEQDKAYNIGRLEAFQEAIRLIETVSKLETEK